MAVFRTDSHKSRTVSERKKKQKQKQIPRTPSVNSGIFKQAARRRRKDHQDRPECSAGEKKKRSTNSESKKVKIAHSQKQKLAELIFDDSRIETFAPFGFVPIGIGESSGR